MRDLYILMISLFNQGMIAIFPVSMTALLLTVPSQGNRDNAE